LLAATACSHKRAPSGSASAPAPAPSPADETVDGQSAGEEIEFGARCPAELWSLADWVHPGADERVQKANEERRPEIARRISKKTFSLTIQYRITGPAPGAVEGMSAMPSGSMQLGEYDVASATSPLFISSDFYCDTDNGNLAIRLSGGDRLVYRIPLAKEKADELRQVWVAGSAQSLLGQVLVRFHVPKSGETSLPAEVLGVRLRAGRQTIFSATGPSLK
jgi:hypothetical protein